MVKPLNTAGRLSPKDLRFLEEFNRAGDSLERMGYAVIVTYRDTLLVVSPSDSLRHSPWALTRSQYSQGWVFYPGHPLTGLSADWTSEQMLVALRGWQAIPRPARTLTLLPTHMTVRTIGAGGAATCGLTPTGRASCWGANDVGQLGDGDTADAARPVAVAGEMEFTDLSVGADHACALDRQGRAFCWGKLPTDWSKSSSPFEPKRTPLEVPGGRRFAGLATGGTYSCGRTAAGQAFCWGWGARGQLGDGGHGSSIPVPVGGGHTFVGLAAGQGHACGWTVDGQAFCWGWNDRGQLGDGTTVDRFIPVPVAGDIRFAEIRALGYGHTCGLATDGRAYCWGGNREEELDDGTVIDRRIPTPVAGRLTFVALSAGDYHTCGRTSDGRGFCWGNNSHGERGDGGATSQAPGWPSPVTGGVRFVEIRAGGDHTCGLTGDGLALCWGGNAHGALGAGTAMPSLGPVQVISRP